MTGVRRILRPVAAVVGCAAVAVAASLSLAAGARADDGARWLRLERIRQAGGAVAAVAVPETGPYAYLGVGPRVVVVDVADSTRPRPVGQSPVLAGAVQSIALDGGYAYVAGGLRGGLTILDLSDPVHPRRVAALETPGTARRVQLQGRRAFVADGNNRGVVVVDVSDPHQPRRLAPIGVSATDIAVAGRHVYAVTGDTHVDSRCDGLSISSVTGQLRVVDVGDEDAPRLLSTLPWGMRLAAAAPPLLLVAGARELNGGAETLQLLDVSDGAAPRPLGSLRLVPGETRLVVAGTRAYLLGAYGHSLAIIDLSEPSWLLELSLTGLGSELWDVAARGSTVYLADRREGLLVVDATEPRAPRVVGRYRPPGLVERLAVGGGRAYTLDGCSVGVVDLADPDGISEQARLGTSGPGAMAPSALAVGSDGVAYAATRGPDSGQVLRVDGRRGAAAVFEPVLNLDGPVDALALSGGYGYVGSRQTERGRQRPVLTVFEHASGRSPRRLGQTPLARSVDALAAGGGFVFGSGRDDDGSAELVVVDARDATAPRVLPLQPIRPVLPANRRPIAVFGPQLLVSGGGWHLFDSSEPGRPEILATVPSDAELAQVSGPLVVAAGPRIAAYDVSNPRDPGYRASFLPLGCPSDMAVVGQRVYLAEGHFGIEVLRLVASEPASRLFLPLAGTGTRRTGTVQRPPYYPSSTPWCRFDGLTDGRGG
jgi:hypothetical protein